MMRKKDPIPMEEFREEYQRVFEQLKTITVPWNKAFKVDSFTIYRKTITASSGSFYGEMKFVSNVKDGKEEYLVSRFNLRIMNSDWSVKLFGFGTNISDGGEKSIDLVAEKDNDPVLMKIYSEIREDHPELEELPIKVFSYNDFALYRGKGLTNEAGYRRYCAYFVKNKNSNAYEWIWISKLELTGGRYYKWKYVTHDNLMPSVYWTKDELKEMIRRGRERSPVKPSVVQDTLSKVIEDIQKAVDIKITKTKILSTHKIGRLTLYIVWALTDRGMEFHFLMSSYEGTLRYTLDAYQADNIEEVLIKNLFNETNSKVIKV